MMADQGAEGLLSPFLRKQRIRAVKPYLNGSILDYGCGSGELAREVSHENYFGIDIDQESILVAREKFSSYRFASAAEPCTEKFDTVVSMAVIEHVKQPEQFLFTLAGFLSKKPSARIVITTPHPSMDWIHGAGSSIGLFSKHANDEHEELLDRKKLSAAGEKCQLVLSHYSRFLFGANQIAIFKIKSNN